MLSRARRLALGVVLALTFVACSQIEESTESFSLAACEVGIYGAADSFVVITRRGDDFRYSFSDGRRGDVSSGDDVECGENAIRTDAGNVLARRDIAVTDTTFVSGNVTLAGQLLERVEEALGREPAR